MTSNWPEQATERPSLAALRAGPAGAYLSVAPVMVSSPDWRGEPASLATLIVPHLLQDLPDYRLALQAWFAAVRPGGYLVLTVPNTFLYERRLALPVSDHPERRRLYTPRSLMEEVEEALAPNSYRVRLLCDDDADYDYGAAAGAVAGGRSDVVLVVERIAAPDWSLEPPQKQKASAPDYAFEPSRTRFESRSRSEARRILLLKLDHLGDFIMGIASLEKVRTLFPDAHITLIVGSWNADIAQSLGLADRVLSFDAFPRNSSEEEVDVHARRGLFTQLLPDHFDLAIDMRTDADTRQLLRIANATIRAGIGTKAQFPFLDIFLPLDFNRNEPETAMEFQFGPHSFASQDATRRLPFRIMSEAARAQRRRAIIWGPYNRLRPGNYIFEPYLEFDLGGDGLVMLDIGLNARRVVQKVVGAGEAPRLTFNVDQADLEFEFRIWTVDDVPSIDFSFFGGRLMREGAASVLHQSEYGSLLVQLVYERLTVSGLLGEADH